MSNASEYTHDHTHKFTYMCLCISMKISNSNSDLSECHVGSNIDLILLIRLIVLWNVSVHTHMNMTVS